MDVTPCICRAHLSMSLGQSVCKNTRFRLVGGSGHAWPRGRGGEFSQSPKFWAVRKFSENLLFCQEMFVQKCKSCGL